MGHAIDDEIDSDFKGIGREFERVIGIVRPLPRVSKVGIPVDQNHQAAVVVEDATHVGYDAVILVGRTTVLRAPALANVGHLYDAIDVVKHMKHGMFRRHLDDRTVGENQLHLRQELIPGPAAPEVVDNQETAGQQVISQRQRFRLGQRHRTDFDGVEQWKLPQPGIGQFDRIVRSVGIDDTEPFQGHQELVICFWIIDRPASAFVIIVELPTIDSTGKIKFM